MSGRNKTYPPISNQTRTTLSTATSRRLCRELVQAHLTVCFKVKLADGICCVCFELTHAQETYRTLTNAVPS